jgi:riboflavin synthase alpha subunit
MFTGIVTQRATVTESRPLGEGGGAVRFSVLLDLPLAGLSPGDSVALDGCCLTVVSAAGRAVSFDAVPETLRRTTLGDRRPGDRVHVEPALRAGDPLGGHLVQGHVEGVGRVERVERRGDDVRLTVALPEALRGSALEKASVAVDGVSLTISDAGEDGFSVHLVPHTLAVTGLGERRVGDRVNLEADVVGRWVEHHVRRMLPASPAREGVR